MENKIKQYFGYSFRGGQQEVVRQILSGNDVAVFWSTGSGKSMCYQLPALITGKVCIMHALPATR
jgi:superfamily II DNA helicase RecQ